MRTNATARMKIPAQRNEILYWDPVECYLYRDVRMDDRHFAVILLLFCRHFFNYFYKVYKSDEDLKLAWESL